MNKEINIYSGITLTALALLVLMPILLPSITLATEIVIFAFAALACNLLLGYTGLLSLGQGIFFGGGAYTASLVMIHLNFGMISALLTAMFIGGVLALLVGALAIRRTGIYFVMLTLAFTQMAYFLAYTFSNWTGGDNGLFDIPRPELSLFGITISKLESSESFYVFVAFLFIAIFIFSRRVIHSPFGTTLVAIRENESRASAVGFSTSHFKLIAFVISGVITGLAGALYAMLLNFAPLSNIELAMSENILIMTIIGGTSSLLGSILGSGAIVLIGDILSPLWPRWMMILGAALIGVVLFMPGGIWGGITIILSKLTRNKKSNSGSEIIK